MIDERADLEVSEYVTLVDRTGGPGEFMYDGRPRTFPKGKPTRIVPLHVATFIIGRQKQHVWTVDGQFVPRFTIQDGPEGLLDQLGEEAFDTSPITIDTTRTEGWDTSLADRGATRTLELKRQPGDFVNQGSAVTGTFSGKER